MYEIIILKYYCGRQIDGWAGPIDEWAVLTYGSEQKTHKHTQTSDFARLHLRVLEVKATFDSIYNSGS